LTLPHMSRFFRESTALPETLPSSIGNSSLPRREILLDE
jgi:hypothetical protein